MGFTPADVDAMSLWQFMAALDGWVEAHTPEDQKSERMSENDATGLSAWMDEKG